MIAPRHYRAASDTSPAQVSRDTRQLQDAGGSDTSPHYDPSMSPERRPPSVDDEFLTVAEVAAILKLNQQTIRNWIDAGSLPALRVGRRVRVLRRDLDQLLAEASASAGQPGPSAGADGEGWRDAEAFWGGE